MGPPGKVMEMVITSIVIKMPSYITALQWQPNKRLQHCPMDPD
ncbi:hypothetical protein KAM385_08100 [Aeromonas hydrophila]|nr:hypothetical protein KAM385_08100 [Aeromonas hydrophila]